MDARQQTMPAKGHKPGCACNACKGPKYDDNEPPAPTSDAEVNAIAAAEGLTLIRNDASKYGFSGVSFVSREGGDVRTRRWAAEIPGAPLWKGSQKIKQIGKFRTKFEAGLAIARKLGPKLSAERASEKRNRSGWLISTSATPAAVSMSAAEALRLAAQEGLTLVRNASRGSSDSETSATGFLGVYHSVLQSGRHRYTVKMATGKSLGTYDTLEEAALERARTLRDEPGIEARLRAEKEARLQGGEEPCAAGRAGDRVTVAHAKSVERRAAAAAQQEDEEDEAAGVLTATAAEVEAVAVEVGSNAEDDAAQFVEVQVEAVAAVPPVAAGASPPPPPPFGWRWPLEGERIDVEVQMGDAEPLNESQPAVVWVPAEVLAVLVDGQFQARIVLPDGSDAWEDWFSWQEEGVDWQRGPPPPPSATGGEAGVNRSAGSGGGACTHGAMPGGKQRKVRKDKGVKRGPYARRSAGRGATEDAQANLAWNLVHGASPDANDSGDGGGGGGGGGCGGGGGGSSQLEGSSSMPIASDEGPLSDAVMEIREVQVEAVSDDDDNEM